MAKPRYNPPPAELEDEPDSDVHEKETLDDYVERKNKEEDEAEDKRLKDRYGDTPKPFDPDDDTWDPHMGCL
jgi:hypothetical protein